MLLAVRQLAKSFGVVSVLESVSFVVNNNDRVGVVGANGAGKSTLLSILAGQESADVGEVVYAPSLEIGFLPQTMPALHGQTIEDLVRESVGQLRRLEARMRELEAALSTAGPHELPTLLEEYGLVSTRFQDGGGYELEARLDATTAGLGIAHISRAAPVETLSGGEKARVGLATLLLRAPDLLLLDEPTNHLDYASLTWLETYLAQCRGAILVVSHDREFLNCTVNRVIAIDEHSHQIKQYTGSYDAYSQARAAERAQWEEDYQRQQEEIRELRLRVRDVAGQVGHKNRPPRDNDKSAAHFFGERIQRTVARNVRAAAEQLKRIEANPVPQPPKPIQFNPRFNAAAMRSREVVTISHLARHLGGRPVLQDVSLSVGPDARILLAGSNGAGKTTLLRVILGLLAPDAGEVRITASAQIGYLPQEPARPDPRRTVLESYKEGLVGLDAQFIAGLLGHGFFRLEDLTKRVAQLSVGQRRKLEIARLVARRPNVLLLDEPTNYLSLDVLEAFEATVLAFPGPVIAASHDRWFIRRFRGEVWELADGRLIKHTDAEEYLASKLIRVMGSIPLGDRSLNQFPHG